MVDNYVSECPGPFNLTTNRAGLLQQVMLDSSRANCLLAVAAVCIGIILNRWAFGPKLNVPLLLADAIQNSNTRALEYFYRPRKTMWKGWQKYPDRTYGINTRDGVKVVIPPKFLDALKSHPHLSFDVSINNDMLVDYTRFGAPPEFVTHAVKSGMTASLPTLTPILHENVKKNMPRIIGDHKVWTKTKIHDEVLRIIGHNNARVFHSTAASLNDEWVKYSTSYVLTTFGMIQKLKEWRPFLRPIVHWLISERKEINKQWSLARIHVQNSLAARKAKGGNLEDPPSMLDYLSSGKNACMADNLNEQLRFQMTLVAVGTVTTHASVCQAVYDLATYPEYVPILREEVESVSRGQDGNFTKESLAAMTKLDSFMKESQRLTAGDLSTFQRAATADIVLPDGNFIPKGTKLEVNTASIHVDERNYPNPRTFDGLRYHRMRQEPGQENKHMFYSVSKNDLSFGFGRHACPGRYLGQVNIKLVLAELLMRYEIKSTLQSGRPSNIEFEAIVSPDPNFEIWIKNRMVS